jgi:hypothetical protein
MRGDGMNTLESRCRRMLMLLPAAYRERRGEEMLSTLLDGAGDRQVWPRIAEVASVAALAARLRVGAPGGTRRSAVYGEVLRRVALAGLLWQVLVYVTFLVPVAEMSIFTPWLGVYKPMSARWVGYWALAAGRPAVLLTGFLALALGRRRTGRVLSVLCGANAVVTFALDANFGVTSENLALLTLALLVAAAALLGFHRDAPRVQAPRRWLGVMLVALVLVVGVEGTASYLSQRYYHWSFSLFVRDADVVFSPIGPALVMGFAALRARKSVVWPAALLALGLPCLILVPRYVVLLSQGKAGHRFPGSMFWNQIWPGIGVDILVTETVLAANLWWALRRHRLNPADTVARAADTV